MAFISRSMHTRVYQAQTVLKVNAACRRNKVKVQGPRTSTEKFLKTVTKTTSFAGVSAFPSPMKTLAFINARLFTTVPIVQVKKRSDLVQCVMWWGLLKVFSFPVKHSQQVLKPFPHWNQRDTIGCSPENVAFKYSNEQLRTLTKWLAERESRSGLRKVYPG